MKISVKSIKDYISATAVFLAIILAIIAVFVIVCQMSNRYSVTDYSSESKAETNAESDEISYEYLCDMSQYEKYFNPLGDLSKSFLTLSPKSGDKEPSDLVSVTADNVKGEIMLREYAAKALEAMLLEMKAEGVNTVNSSTKLPLTVVAGYKKDADDEHTLGLTVDMHNCQTSDISFSATDAYEWLSENCYKFGFIVRYPEDKYQKTGVAFRPWQFRFVGRLHAQIIYENNLCLEEYTGSLK